MPYRLIMEQNNCVEQPCYCDVMQGVWIEKKNALCKYSYSNEMTHEFK